MSQGKLPAVLPSQVLWPGRHSDASRRILKIVFLVVLMLLVYYRLLHHSQRQNAYRMDYRTRWSREEQGRAAAVDGWNGGGAMGLVAG